ncbi:MAG: glycosyltransferase family 4 protein [Thermodesulfobacteriota bacterium]
MLTILHTESSSGWGGQENRTLHECLGLKKTFGHHVIILCRPDSRLRERATEAGIEVRTHRLKASHDLGAIRFITGHIRRERVDVVVTHSGVDSFLAGIAARLSRRQPKVVRTRHLALPITSKSSYSMIPHRVVTVSEFVRRYLIEDKGLKSNHVVAIPTGIDLARFNAASAPGGFREAEGIGADVPVVGTVAILRRKKGHHVLLEAIPAVLKKIPDALFVFVGNGPQRENIEAQIKRLGIEKNVRRLGLRKDVETVLKGLDIFVLPTFQEALGTSILEASAMEVPVISTGVGGVPEVVREGVTGLLVEPDNAEELAEAIIKLLKDPALRASMGAEGKKLVERDFSTIRMVERLHELYSSLAKGKRR